MSLPSSWVDRIFEKLTLTYGQQFMRRWQDIDPALVRDDWSRELDGFERFPEAIKFALQHLPADNPPNVLQFRAIARRAPPPEVPQLPSPAPDPQRVHREIEKMRATPEKKERDLRGWARAIVARAEAGEPVTRTVLGMAREALREAS